METLGQLQNDVGEVCGQKVFRWRVPNCVLDDVGDGVSAAVSGGVGLLWRGVGVGGEARFVRRKAGRLTERLLWRVLAAKGLA